MCQACLLVLLYSIMHEQGIFEIIIEDGAFFEDEQHMKLSARGAEIFRLGNILFGRTGGDRYDFQRGAVCTYV